MNAHRYPRLAYRAGWKPAARPSLDTILHDDGYAADSGNSRSLEIGVGRLIVYFGIGFVCIVAIIVAVVNR